MTKHVTQVINFSAKSTKDVAVELAKRMEDNTFQVLTVPTGFGKTAITVATAGIIAHKMKRDVNVFVIAPRAKLDEESWEWTIEQYNNIAKYKLNLMDKSTPTGIANADKNDKILKRDLKALPPKKLANMRFLKQWYSETLKTPTVFLIDEVQDFKNPTSKRTKALTKLIKGGLAIGMSATPMSNGLLQDGVAYLVLNGLYTSNSDFQKKHIPKGCYDEYYNPDVYLPNGDIDPNRFIDLDLFHERIKKTIYAPKVEVDFDLPDTTITAMMYELSEQTRQDMRKINKDYRERRYDTYMKYLADLRNAIGSDINHARMLAKILLKYKPRQPLIFYHTNAELANIEFTLEKMQMPYKIINGNPKNKIQYIDKSITEQAIVIQYRAGGAGIEFKESNLTIFYGLQYSWQDTEQALGRNVRRGMTGQVDRIFLVASNPHDDKIFSALINKREFTQAYLSEIAEEISKDSD